MKTKVIEITIDENTDENVVERIFKDILALLDIFDIPSSCAELREDEVNDEG